MKHLLLTLTILLFTNIAWAQTSVSGKVTDANGATLIGATVMIEGTTKGSISDLNGEFKLMVDNGEYTLIASYIGYSNKKNPISISGTPVVIDFVLEEDQLGLDEIIVTGVFNNKSKLESSVAITTIRPDEIRRRLPRSTADLLNAVPGTYADNASGEVGNRIYARGMASGTTDNTGYRYVSLQEDGLPVMSSLVQFATADMFTRIDVNVGRFEAIRGGSSVVTAPNAPGGVYNFISREGGSKFSGIAELKAGVNGRDNLYTRADLGFGGPISTSGLNYYIGGFYRFDEGARDLPFDANVGGQLKGNIVKTHEKGKVKLYAKYLKDKVTQYRPIPFANFNNLDKFEGGLKSFDRNYSSTFPSLNTQIPDYSYGKSGTTRDFNADEGIDVMTFAIGLDVTQDFGEWTVNYNIKYTKADQRFLQYIANVVAPIDFAMAGFGYAPPTFNPNEFRFYDAKSGELLHHRGGGVTNIGENLFATFTLDMNNEISDLMNQLTVSRTFGNHSISFGTFGASNKLEAVWHGDVLTGTLEPNSRLVRIEYPNPLKPFIPTDPDFLQVTDPNGVAAYNFVTLIGFEGTSVMFSAFANDIWEVSPQLTLDLGFRYDNIQQEGFKRGWDRPTANTFGLPNGADGSYVTLYDATARIHNEQKYEYNESYDMFSFSVGANYRLNDSQALFARVSKGNKAPDHEWYISNFENNAEIGRGTVEKVYQAEIGYKLRKKKYSLFATAFYSLLDDVTYQAFITSSNTTFFTPPTFNKTRTIGLEIEATASPVKNLDFRLTATLQDPEFVNFELYNLNGTTPSLDGSGGINNPLLPDPASDDFLETLDGNKVGDIPSLITDLTVSYQIRNFLLFGNWRYTGKYQYNKRNIFKMPDYSVFNVGVSCAISSRLSIVANINNVLNSFGVTRTEGLAKLDGNKEFFTKEEFEQHENNAYGIPGLQGSVWGVPILPRMMTLSINYQF